MSGIKMLLFQQLEDESESQEISKREKELFDADMQLSVCCNAPVREKAYICGANGVEYGNVCAHCGSDVL